ncbi:MAG: flagellar hook-basal body complex protein [Desulfovibrio sp.]|jgi:flagellar hook protein FlgE|nr:flagellar hook-basal body complex protein [Desulfovibrio sp.]
MMSSLYIGATGMVSHGEGIAVIANNLANVNTVGYKQISLQYADLMSQYLTASSANLTNCNQKGMGAAPLETRTLFTLGGFERGSEATDLAINGIGFFGVQRDGLTQYTRAGDFRFSKEGWLLDPSGWNVLGRAIVNGQEAGAATPIKLNLNDEGIGYMPSRMTAQVTSCSNLGGLEDKNSSPANPFFSLASSWDGTSSTPLGEQSYAYSEAIEFYDADGVRRTATIYYDAAGESGGMKAVEYLVAMEPGEDASGFADTAVAGLLMAGTITFASNGEMASMTAFSPPVSGNPADLSAWTPAPLREGLPVFSVTPRAASAGQNIALDSGYVFAAGASAGAGQNSAADIVSSDVFRNSTDKSLKPRATVALGERPSGLYFSTDGYAEGYLRYVNVTPDGIVRGNYSNGQTEDLWRVTIYRFTSQDGLRHEGSNHYSATTASGAAGEGVPGEENFGTLAEFELEQSNVDYAREFSLLIVTQRGFQMNSKVVTTSDLMLQRALELKR